MGLGGWLGWYDFVPSDAVTDWEGVVQVDSLRNLQPALVSPFETDMKFPADLIFAQGVPSEQPQ